MSADQISLNNAFWQSGEYLRRYANRQLAPVEVLILVRYRDSLSGRVVELGCGAGRLLGYLTQLSDRAHGVDLSPKMVEYCRRAFPSAKVRVGDLAHLERVFDGPFDAIFASNNVLDIFDDTQRRRLLAGYRSLLAPRGLLIFSSHNLADLVRARHAERDRIRDAGRWFAQLPEKSPRQLAGTARRLPARARNHRRLRVLERQGDGYAIVNDPTHDYALLHYFITREAQERQLVQTGYELLECLDRDGYRVSAGQEARGPWLHYVARAAAG